MTDPDDADTASAVRAATYHPQGERSVGIGRVQRFGVFTLLPEDARLSWSRGFEFVAVGTDASFVLRAAATPPGEVSEPPA